MSYSEKPGKEASNDRNPSAVAPAASETGLVRLTSDGRFKRDPVFWPGRKELVYTEVPLVTKMVPGGEESRLWLMRMDWEKRTSAPFVRGKNFCVSSDGSVYAYSVVFNCACSMAKVLVEDVKQQRKATIENRRLPSFPDDYNSRPSLAPSGDRLAFVKIGNRLVVVDLWKDNARDVELGVAGDQHPHFSPDGRKIVFTSRRDRDFEIYVTNADGSDQQRLTRSRGIDKNPVFSPEGSRIAFTSNRDGNYEIYVMDADGRNPRRVTRSSERSDFACWHPDGKRLVFVGERNGRFDLYMVEAPAS
jgi:dipeptidyl aminopeptidase/acylaminoacyl peptidase